MTCPVNMGSDGQKGDGHTPTPWFFRLEAVRTVIFHKGDIGERAIAVGAGHYPDHVGNARFIVTACNHHAELVEALRDARSCIMQGAEYGDIETLGFDEYPVVEQIDAVLAKLGGVS